MKLDLYDNKGTKKKSIDLPEQFEEEIRNDLIKKAFVAINSKSIQPYGAKPGAGMRSSAKISRRRHNYRGAYGFGISRVPRKILTRRGLRFFWVGAVAPGTVGGRKAHAPKAEKKLIKNINDKERKKAIRSAISANMMTEVVAKKQKVPKNYPFGLSEDVEKISKTKDLKKLMLDVGLEEEIQRIARKTIRAGKGKMRGRKYKTKTGPLIVVSDECPLLKIKNLSGLDIIKVNELNALTLSPGGTAGRITLFTEGAIKNMKDKRLFI